jgi:hypothetical protein
MVVKWGEPKRKTETPPHQPSMLSLFATGEKVFLVKLCVKRNVVKKF